MVWGLAEHNIFFRSLRSVRGRSFQRSAPERSAERPGRSHLDLRDGCCSTNYPGISSEASPSGNYSCVDFSFACARCIVDCSCVKDCFPPLGRWPLDAAPRPWGGAPSGLGGRTCTWRWIQRNLFSSSHYGLQLYLSKILRFFNKRSRKSVKSVSPC